jgi:hypothetical protein
MKVNFALEQAMKAQGGGVEYLKPNGGGCSTPRPGRFNPRKEARHPAPGPVWTDAENLIPNQFRSPDRPARSVYLLRYSSQRSITYRI